MKIMYYDIHDCGFELIDNKPAIIAPEGTDPELLKKYDFVQLLDGRWCHYMTMDEKLYMADHKGEELLVFYDIEETKKLVSKQKEHETAVRTVVFIAVMLGIFALFFLIVFIRMDQWLNNMENSQKECWDSCQGIGEMGSRYLYFGGQLS